MLDAASRILFWRGTNLFRVRGDFLEKALYVNALALRLHPVEVEHRLREQVDCGLPPATLEAQVERRGDPVERRDELLEIALGLGEQVLERFGSNDILAAIEDFDGLIEFGAHGTYHPATRAALKLLLLLDGLVFLLTEWARLTGTITLVQFEQRRLVRAHFAERAFLPVLQGLVAIAHPMLSAFRL